jgi:hypothetical protein
VSQRWLSRLERWWFAPDARHQPGVWRILLSAWAAQKLGFDILPRLSDYATRPRELADPVTIARVLALPIPEPSWVGPLQTAVLVLAAASVLGVFTRVAMIAFALLAAYVGLIANGWGYSAHATGLPFIALFVVAFAPGIDALSFDAWLAARRARRRGEAAVSHDRLLGTATSVWPLRLMLVLVVLTYFTAGVSKLRHTGPQWADGKTLAFYLGGGSLRDRVSPQRFIADPESDRAARFRDGVGLLDWAWLADPTPLGKAVAGSPLLTRLLSIFALVLELVFPLALSSRKSTFALLSAALLLHLGIQATMRISFLSYAVVYALFVDWYAVSRWISGKLRLSLIPTKKVLESR